MKLGLLGSNFWPVLGKAPGSAPLSAPLQLRSELGAEPEPKIEKVES